jgi:hypothetical protein
MNESYFIGTWLATPAHPDVKVVLEINFQKDSQVLIYLGDQTHFGNWNFDHNTRLITLSSTLLNTPNAIFKIENDRTNSFDLVGAVIPNTVYFTRK